MCIFYTWGYTSNSLHLFYTANEKERKKQKEKEKKERQKREGTYSLMQYITAYVYLCATIICTHQNAHIFSLNSLYCDNYQYVGTYMTKKQKQQAAIAQQRLEAMRAAGMEVRLFIKNMCI